MSHGKPGIKESGPPLDEPARAPAAGGRAVSEGEEPSLFRPQAETEYRGRVDLHPGERERQRIDGILSDGNLIDQPLIAIAPGSVWPTKRWLKERFGEVIRTIWDKHQMHSVLIGGPEDEGLAEDE